MNFVKHIRMADHYLTRNQGKFYAALAMETVMGKDHEFIVRKGKLGYHINIYNMKGDFVAFLNVTGETCTQPIEMLKPSLIS